MIGMMYKVWTRWIHSGTNTRILGSRVNTFGCHGFWAWTLGLNYTSGCEEVGTGTKIQKTGRKKGEPVVGTAAGLDRKTTGRFGGNDASSGQTTCRLGRLPRAGAWARGQIVPMFLRRVEARAVDSDDGKKFQIAWNFLINPMDLVVKLEETDEECDYLIDLAKPSMKKSTVVDSETGKSRDSRVRTSSGTFLARGRDKTIRNIEKRIADFTFIPADHGEGLQILHYEVGQKYEPHYDYFLDDFNTVNGGQRMATLLMYLSDVEEGGETVFPAAKGNISSVPWWNELSDCGKKGLSVKAKRGDALLFWSMKPDATLDSSSLHGGCPVIKGNKWSSTKWMRVNEYKA